MLISETPPIINLEEISILTDIKIPTEERKNYKRLSMSALKVQDTSITESKDIEMVEMPDKNLKSLILKMINEGLAE
jgi:hypothetical protein